jgi:hypothetical protein
MEDYIKQMQEYLNKNSSKNDDNINIIQNFDENANSHEEPNLNMDKDQLFEQFQQILNNKMPSNFGEEDKQKEDVKEKKPQNYDDMPLPALKNKKNNLEEKNGTSNKNIDDIPIKGNSNLNFNELLEKELSKEQNEGNYNNNISTKPKFKYIPKKKVDLVSAPTNTKKYKYYSDNFKPKTRGKSVNITKKMNINKNNDILEKEDNMDNNSDDFDKYNNKNNNQAKKKRVAPVMPENFKNSKFNRGRGYTGPLNEPNTEKNNIIENNNNNINLNSNDKNNDNNNNNKNINSLWGEFQNNYEQVKDENDENEAEEFHDNEEDDNDEIKMNLIMPNNILDKNKNNFNKNKNEKQIFQQQHEEDDHNINLLNIGKGNEKKEDKEDFGVINEEYIKNLMNYDVHDVEDILNLNNKINPGNDELAYNNNIDNENNNDIEDNN